MRTLQLTPTASARRGRVGWSALLAAVTAAGSMLLVGCAGGGPTVAAGTTRLDATTGPSGDGRPPITIGAVFPVHGMQSALADEELTGVRIAAQLVNAGGGVDGRRIKLMVHDLETPQQAAGAVAAVKAAGARAVIGAYSSQLSMPAAAAAARDGVVYWEAGAVVDRLTGTSPLVFRVGATGGDLGANSGRFAATVLASRLGLAPQATRVAVVYENDAYGTSVADAALKSAHAAGMPIVSRVSYDYYSPHWPSVLQQLAAAQPDVLILASYIPDGVAFRRAMLASHLKVGAMIGSTMAECGPTFGGELGPQAVGVFASDRPEGGFNPGALNATGAATYARLLAAWNARTGEPAPSEEALAGFSAGWALFHDALARARAFDARSIAAAARTLRLPVGTLPNGAGLQFGTGPSEGQNTRAAAVIWQWQAPDHSVVVWPPTYATGSPHFVPLPA